jgi:hypothetical protein
LLLPELSGTLSSRSASTRAGGKAVILAFVVIGAALMGQDLPGGSTDTIYPWWVWVLVVVGLFGGLVSVAKPLAGTGVERLAPAIAVIAAAQVAGSGFVAFKHWEPSMGMGGGNTSDLPQLKLLAVVVGVAGLVAVLVGLGQLVSNGDLPHPGPPRLRVLSCVLGLAVIVGLPSVLAAADADMRDLTSWGAVGLIYAGPWGVSLMAVGWLTRPPAVAALATVAVSVCLALRGPQMTDLVFGNPAPAFAAVLLLTVLLFLALLTQAGDESRVGKGTSAENVSN